VNQAQDEQIVHWLYQVTVKDGQLQNLKDLIVEMVANTEASEPETLAYSWVVSDDGTIGEVHERYANSEAALAHLATFNRDFAARLGTMVDLRSQLVYGNPSAALKQAIAGSKPVYFNPVAGFQR
jgi:quinol monooxygenase YgiN